MDIKKSESAATKLNREEQARINRLFYQILGKEGEPVILEDLVRKFEVQSLAKRLPDGSIDPTALAMRAGAYEVVSFIKQRIKLGAEGK